VEQDWSVLRDGTGYEDDGSVYAVDVRHAAEKWAATEDANGDYAIVGGSAARVRLTAEDGTVTEFIVQGESEPVYTARLVVKP